MLQMKKLRQRAAMTEPSPHREEVTQLRCPVPSPSPVASLVARFEARRGRLPCANSYQLRCLAGNGPSKTRRKSGLQVQTLGGKRYLPRTQVTCIARPRGLASPTLWSGLGGAFTALALPVPASLHLSLPPLTLPPSLGPAGCALFLSAVAERLLCTKHSLGVAGTAADTLVLPGSLRSGGRKTEPRK